MTALAASLLVAVALQDTVSLERKLLATIPKKVDVDPGLIAFAPDGRSVAYAGTKGKISFIVFGDPKKVVPFAWVEKPVFSPDGSRIAYLANEGGQVFGGKEGVRGLSGGRWLVVAGDKKGNLYDEALGPVFDPDGKTAVFVARRMDRGTQSYRCTLVRGGRAEPEGPESRLPVFSPDGRRTARAERDAGKNGRWRVTVDGVAGEPFDFVSDPAFRPDGGAVAYLAGTAGATEGLSDWFVVVDAVRKPAGEGVDRLPQAPVYSADGSTLAFVAPADAFKVRLTAGDRAGSACTAILDPVLSADGKRVAHSARDDADWFVVIDHDKRHGPYAQVGPAAFSTDGARVAYTARSGEVWSVFVDGKSVGDYDFAGRPIFSADGTRLAFGARTGDELWWIVLPLDR